MVNVIDLVSYVGIKLIIFSILQQQQQRLRRQMRTAGGVDDAAMQR